MVYNYNTYKILNVKFMETEELIMDLMELLKTRRTYRRFEQKEISQEIIDEILLAARYSSSAMNKQILRYVVIKDAEKVANVFKYTKWAGALPPELGQPKENERPVLFIGVVKDEAHPFADTDAGLAISNMTLSAWNHGVGSCIIGACNKEKLFEIFGLEEGQMLHTVVAFGYPAHESKIVDMESPDKFSYYLDEKKDYIVPKRRLEDIVRYL